MAAKRPAAGLQHPTVVPENLTTDGADGADDGTARCPACGQPLGEH